MKNDLCSKLDTDLLDGLNLMVGRIEKYNAFPEVIDYIKSNYFSHLVELRNRGMTHTASFYEQQWYKKTGHEGSLGSAAS